MAESSKAQVLEALRSRLAAGDVDEVRVTLRVAGGMPGERLAAREVALSGAGEAAVHAEEAGAAVLDTTVELSEEETFELLRKLGDGGEDLVERYEARFVPDSLVGSVTIEVGGQQTTLYYLADEGQREDQQQYLSPPAAEAVDQLAALAERALEGGEG